jgi:hypothetical protein
MFLAIDQFWWLAALAGVSLAVSLGGLLAVRWVVISLPEDYFVAEEAQGEWRHQHPLVRWSWFAAKNLLGAVLLAAGVTMLVTPGPGVLAILLGLSLITVPGKRTLVLRILRNPHVLSAMNLLRTQARRPALLVPPSDDNHG